LQNKTIERTIEMSKSIKHHLIGNWASNKTVCGIEFKKPNIRIVEFDSKEKAWFNDFGDQLDSANWQDTFCLNCLRLHESNLIEQLKMETFLIEYKLSIPKSNRAKKKKQAQLRRKRNGKSNSANESISKQLDKKKKSPSKKSASKKQSNSIPKSDKGKAREKRKQSNSNKPTESKCKIINKPKTKPIKKEKVIELVNEVKKPIAKKPAKKEVIESGKMDKDFAIGDPIKDKEIFELGIGSKWRMVRHDKQLNMWKLQFKTVTKGIPNWIDDTEFVEYEFLSEMVNEGYCN
jgi:hypothetical protein